ncbi:two-component system response regulator [Blastomonas aquatica]|uniref:Two-component system response regulator n=2 Tax=Blastomonas aquatica TaxID=1510276 RepID=A0ABQ1JLU2_9SPHN|nr:two-component system response regulator [Blastomonas aquatica]
MHPRMGSANLILIADDEPLLTELLEYRLRAKGFDTAIARDGREALEQFEAVRPNAVVLDAMMPVHDGFEVLRRIRSNEAHSDIPIIMLSARRSQADIVGALEMGASDYIVKPFLPEELMIRLQRLLAGR